MILPYVVSCEYLIRSQKEAVEIALEEGQNHVG